LTEELDISMARTAALGPEAVLAELTNKWEKVEALFTHLTVRGCIGVSFWNRIRCYGLAEKGNPKIRRRS
jgi:hypothetical protein